MSVVTSQIDQEPDICFCECEKTFLQHISNVYCKNIHKFISHTDSQMRFMVRLSLQTKPNTSPNRPNIKIMPEGNPKNMYHFSYTSEYIE